MFECLILGDSIAYGVSNIRKECVAYTKSGINSRDWITRNIDRSLKAKTAIISLGANDLKNIDTLENLRTVRRKVTADRVFWIMTARKPWVQEHIRTVAQEFGDVIIDRPRDHMSADGVHPTYQGYKILGDQAK